MVHGTSRSITFHSYEPTPIRLHTLYEIHVLRTETPQPITLLEIDIPVALSNRDDPTIALSLCHHSLSRLFSALVRGGNHEAGQPEVSGVRVCPF